MSKRGNKRWHFYVMNLSLKRFNSGNIRIQLKKLGWMSERLSKAVVGKREGRETGQNADRLTEKSAELKNRPKKVIRARLRTGAVLQDSVLYSRGTTDESLIRLGAILTAHFWGFLKKSYEQIAAPLTVNVPHSARTRTTSFSDSWCRWS